MSCVFWVSGGSYVLVDQAAQDRSSADLASVQGPCGDAGRLVFSVGDALADPLTDNGHTEAADSAGPWPDHPVADLSRQRSKRRAMLGGLIHEYRRAA